MSANAAEIVYIFEMRLTSALLLAAAFVLTPAGESWPAPVESESEEAYRPSPKAVGDESGLIANAYGAETNQ
jgi:hypothetical protein